MRLKVVKRALIPMLILVSLVSLLSVVVVNAETDNLIVNFVTTGQKTINVTSPNGGESWVKGTSHSIKWTRSGGGIGGYVAIELYKGGVLNKTIAVSTENDGSKGWTIPSTQALGADYKIKITNNSNIADFDFSDANFAITDPYIKVTSPNGGEKWVRGTSHAIKWTKAGSTGAYVKIELYRGSVLARTINSGTENDGSYGWAVPSNIVLDSSYKIKITSTSKPQYFDWSDNNFTISSPYINVTSPNGGENWKHGTTHTIKWTKAGSTGSYVKIELLRSGSVVKTISSSTYNDGSYSWTISSTQTPATDYKIRITSTSNSAYKDTSDNNFIIST